ncbi:hypothetical protein [Paenibacillus sp. DMB5]|uniref:hypothetical protein n=1 Tax=Paenibacillus sp. DMB5 TaxID=1780103 RepID=UPI00076C8BB3|nr:hypothetical protein [Paenibacillus sp. DMB5]KUP22396.1 hypothetical protein AWJ19_27645 [Paenibacillus sp. DMB5]
MNGMPVQCDNCKGGFHIFVQSRRLEDAVEETYFECPYCKQHYPSFYTNPAVREKQRSIGQLQDRLTTLKDPAKRAALQERIDREQAEVNAMMAVLKSKYKVG